MPFVAINMENSTKRNNAIVIKISKFTANAFMGLLIGIVVLISPNKYRKIILYIKLIYI